MAEDIHVVTSNSHKFNEIQEILSKYGLKVKKSEIKGPELQSDDLSTIAAAAATEAEYRSGHKLLVEDAGLFVRVLNGFPGPYSSYAFRTLGCEGILRLLENNNNRYAEFKSSVAYADAQVSTTIFNGVVRGTIAWEANGAQGFGFDPIFIPRSSDRTFGVMSSEDKNSYSHRKNSLDKFAKWYLDHMGT